MFGQLKFAELRFAQTITVPDEPGVVPVPVWDIKCRADADWAEVPKEPSNINKCNKDL